MYGAHKTKDELLGKIIISPEDNYCKDGKMSDRYEILNYVKHLNDGLMIITSELDGNKGERLSLFQKINGTYKLQTEEIINPISD